MALRRNAQGFMLGGGRGSGAAAHTLTATLMTPSLLQDLIITSDQLGLVNSIQVAGQNVMVSNQAADIRAFNQDAQCEGHRGLGIPLDAQQPVAISVTLAAAGVAAFCVGTDPIAPEAVVPINDLGEALNYCCGLGAIAPGAGAAATGTAVTRRGGELGLLGFSASATAFQLELRSLVVNNVELLSGGPAGASMGVCIGDLLHTCTDIDGRVVGYPVTENDAVSFTVHNYSAGALTVRGNIFMMPTPDIE